MRVFHEISPNNVDTIMKKGILQGSSGTKSNSELIKKADTLLDAARPPAAVEANISRKTNIYGYIGIDEKIIDITDGTHIQIDHFIKNNSNYTLELLIDYMRCYASDLDLYDHIKRLISSHASDRSISTLIDDYWNAIIPLRMFNIGDIRRPEAIITFDITPREIHLIEIG